LKESCENGEEDERKRRKVETGGVLGKDGTVWAPLKVTRETKRRDVKFVISRERGGEE